MVNQSDSLAWLSVWLSSHGKQIFIWNDMVSSSQGRCGENVGHACVYGPATVSISLATMRSHGIVKRPVGFWNPGSQPSTDFPGVRSIPLSSVLWKDDSLVCVCGISHHNLSVALIVVMCPTAEFGNRHITALWCVTVWWNCAVIFKQ